MSRTCFSSRIAFEIWVKFSFYCYYENDNVKLSQVSDRFADEFKANSDWLKFGFHSRNSSTNYEFDNNLYSDFVQTTAELKRIFQGEDSLKRRTGFNKRS